MQDALKQVRELKRQAVRGQRFTGYSGRVRAVAGVFALLGAVAMSLPSYPRTPRAHLIGWSVVLAAALIVNYSALLHWFLFHPDAKRDLQRLMPTVDALPPLLVGAVLSAVFILEGRFELLFGTWMSLYGLANLSSRRVLPRAIWPVGAYYIIAGAICLFLAPAFTNPWPLGLVFFFGEWAGGMVFHRNRVADAPMSSLFLKRGPSDE
ncbi:MAG: hypothetical protein C4521_07840 [Actinobacteria bacterium]|nr:MAG: hypothetical protein C4521_07840 [Actinomycetota bacterium]